MAPRPKPDQAAEEQTPRTFALRAELVDAAGDPFVHVSLGSAPRISLAAGETFTTSDPKLAARLATVAELEETNQ
jgi:hypothetical protein